MENLIGNLKIENGIGMTRARHHGHRVLAESSNPICSKVKETSSDELPKHGLLLLLMALVVFVIALLIAYLSPKPY